MTRAGGPPFFVVGSARSGTTLLRLMLNAHPDIAVPPESRFIVELWEGRADVEVDTLLGRLERHPRFQAWGLALDEVRAELPEAPNFAQIMSAAFLAYARLRRKMRWGDKTPRYVAHIDLLSRLWPEARVVHLVRDGRDVALSYADVPFGPRSVAGVARLWAQRVRAGMTAGRTLGAERYLEARYEAFVADPEGQARRLCDFLGVRYDPGMLDHTERSAAEVLPRAARFNPNVARHAVPNLRSWRTTMPATHVAVFEAVAGDVLAELGYELSNGAAPPGARAASALARLGLPVGRLRPGRRRSAPADN